jgi:MFS family permease
VSVVGWALSTRVGKRLGARGYPRWVLLVALTGMFATTFPVTVLTLAIPTIAEDLGARQSDLAWLITLPVLVSALALPTLGKLGDLYGHRRVFLVGFAVATLTTALTATATNAVLLIAWRTLSQTVGASTIPSSLALINSVHHGEQRARAMGWWSMVAAGAPVVGLALGAPMIEAVGWQMLFVFQAALMVVPVLASWLILRETPRRVARFDFAGALCLAVAVAPLLLAINQAPNWGYTSLPVLGALAIGVVALVAFVSIERRVTAPLMPPELLESRGARSTMAASFLSSASYMGGFFLASLLMVERFGYSLIAAVPILSIRPILFAAFSPVGGWLAGRAGTRVATIAGCLTLAGGMTGLAVGSATASLAVVIGLGFLFQGIGFGLLRPAITTALANAVDQGDLGMAGATERLTGQVGVAFGITILATVYGGDVDRFAAGFAVGAVFGLLGMFTALRMAHKSRPVPMREITPPPSPSEPPT